MFCVVSSVYYLYHLTTIFYEVNMCSVCTTVTLPSELKSFYAHSSTPLSKIVRLLLERFRKEKEFEEQHPGYILVRFPVPAYLAQKLRGDFDVKAFESMLCTYLNEEPPKKEEDFQLGDRTFIFK